jgi:hypothetical protein
MLLYDETIDRRLIPDEKAVNAVPSVGHELPRAHKYNVPQVAVVYS